jgi:hypothetical protein
LLLKDNGFRERVNPLGLHYLILIGGETDQKGKLTCVATEALITGVGVEWDRISGLNASILDLKTDQSVGSVETCVGDYIQQIRWKKVVAHDFTEEDEKAFNLDLETARDADAGKITREQATDRLREISTDHLKRLYDLVED